MTASTPGILSLTALTAASHLSSRFSFMSLPEKIILLRLSPLDDLAIEAISAPSMQGAKTRIFPLSTPRAASFLAVTLESHTYASPACISTEE